DPRAALLRCARWQRWQSRHAGKAFCHSSAGSTGSSTVQRFSGSAVQRFNGSAVQRFNGSTVWLRGGTYYLPEKLVFTAEDSGSKARLVVYQAYGQEQPVISGGVKLEKLDWQPYRDGIVQAKVP